MKVSLILFYFLQIPISLFAAVDTLKGTSDIEDCTVYSYADCNSEASGEDCRRYNSGGIIQLRIGNTFANSHRALVKIPGWDQTIPDSSKFMIYCVYESDAYDRNFFLYPVTTRFYEGTESSALIGNYPDPDSGATWNHAWLDVGNGDSLNWSTAGGDYTTAVACTATVTGIDQYFAFNNFNRILNYWDTSSNDYGFIIINENAFPANNTIKIFRASEGSDSQYPLLLLYNGETVENNYRRRRIIN
ncbi:MAG: hypothetical protein ABIJ12_11955 [bacterium]